MKLTREQKVSFEDNMRNWTQNEIVELFSKALDEIKEEKKSPASTKEGAGGLANYATGQGER
jgi:hypothetical protein